MTVLADRHKIQSNKKKWEHEKEDLKYTIYMKRDCIELLFAVLFVCKEKRKGNKQKTKTKESKRKTDFNDIISSESLHKEVNRMILVFFSHFL